MIKIKEIIEMQDGKIQHTGCKFQTNAKSLKGVFNSFVRNTRKINPHFTGHSWTVIETYDTFEFVHDSWCKSDMNNRISEIWVKENSGMYF